MIYVSEAILAALDHYIEQGVGSRGARAIYGLNEGQCSEEAHVEDLSRFRLVVEQTKDQEEKLVISFAEGPSR